MSGNVARLFHEAAKTHPAASALVTPNGQRVTFTELQARVTGFAAGLARAGIAPGDRAIVMVPMSVELYVVVLGTLSAGAVAVFVDPWVGAMQIARLAAAAHARAFIGSSKAHLLRLLSPALRNIPVRVVTSGLAGRLLATHRLDDFAGHAPLVNRVADDPALITFTTGSSGAPKGVNRTHGILEAQHRVIREEFPARPGDVDMTTFPVFALSNLAAGITTVMPPVNLRRVGDADGGRVARVMIAAGVTTAAASPPLFDALVAHAAAGEPRPALRRVVTGGAPVRDDQLRAWRSTWPDAAIEVAYGSSEAEPVASISADDRLTLAGAGGGFCAGRPVHAVRTRLAPITRGSLVTLPPAAEGIGELLVAGPHVCRDYAGDASAFAENKVRDADGVVWHRMGDTGYFDAAGRFWLVGRVHTTIVRDGVEVHPQILEQAAHGGDRRIRRVAAVGVPANGREQLVIVVESDAPEAARDVADRVAAALRPAAADKVVVTRSRIPVDPRHNSKVDYQRLRDLLQRGALR